MRVQALGIDEVFEVGELWRNEGGQTFDLTGNNVESTDFDFNAALEEADRPSLAKVVNSDDVPDVTGLSVVPDGLNGLVWSWDASDPAYSQQVRIRPSGDADWANETVFDVPLGASEYTTSGLATGDAYEGQVRNVSAAKRTGDWKPDTPVEGTVSGTVPEDFSGVAATLGPGRIEVEGTAGKNTAAGRMYRNTSNDFSAASVVQTISLSPLSAFDVTAGDATATDIISNGGFDSATDWTTIDNVTISGGVASSDSGGAGWVEQAVADLVSIPAEGATLRVTLTISNRVSGSIYVSLDGSPDADSSVLFPDGTYTVELTVPNSLTRIRFRMAIDGDMDDVSAVVDTPACLPSGAAYYWFVPVSAEGVEGTEVALGELHIT